jgi:hypothetical protein
MLRAQSKQAFVEAREESAIQQCVDILAQSSARDALYAAKEQMIKDARKELLGYKKRERWCKQEWRKHRAQQKLWEEERLRKEAAAAQAAQERAAAAQRAAEEAAAARLLEPEPVKVGGNLMAGRLLLLVSELGISCWVILLSLFTYQG